MSVPDFLKGGGEMGALMRAHDWTASSLGAPAVWPQSLRTAVRILLNTGHPMYIFWGADGACLYNDAYRLSIGPERHPGSLGRPARDVWEEIWPIIGPQIDQVMAGKGATWHENHLVPITRNGRREDVYWTYSFGPIDDERAATGVGGVLVICTETTAQVLTAQRLSETQEELNALFNSAASAFYSVGTDGNTRSCNAEFLRILGFADLSDVIGKSLHGVIHHSHPDGTPHSKDECPIYRCAQTGAEAHVPEDVFFRTDGVGVPVEYWVRPLYRQGKLYGAICNFNDISERKQADEQRSLLFRELNHRVKNLFALVGGLVAMTARAAATPRDMATALQGRLGALTRAHELIQPGLRADGGTSEHGTSLVDLIDQIFSPYILSKRDGRIHVQGPEILLSSGAVTGMALIFHELATNAAKYGGLHGRDGRIEVSWLIAGGMLHLTWTETGCPSRSDEPLHTGFGSVLLRRSVENQFGGTIAYEWNADGVKVTISLPLSRIT